MARIEVLDEWFFPQPAKKKGLVFSAPQEALDKYCELREDWLKNHPKLPREEPMVSLVPGKKDEQSGHFVRTGIIYIG